MAKSIRVLALVLVVLAFALPSAPLPSQARNAQTNPITHVIFIIKENRTFDNYFGRFTCAKGRACVNGATTGLVKINGVDHTIPLNTLPDSIQNFSHQWGPAHMDWDNGKMDAFNLGESGCGSAPYPCYDVADPSLIPNYYCNGYLGHPFKK